MRRIIIPEVDFRQASIQEVVAFLVEAARRHDPDGKGVNIVLRENGPTARVNARATSLSLHESLRIVAELTGLQVRVVRGKDAVPRRGW